MFYSWGRLLLHQPFHVEIENAASTGEVKDTPKYFPSSYTVFFSETFTTEGVISSLGKAEVSQRVSQLNMAGNPITCHVLDTATGKPAASMKISLHRQTEAGWQELVSKVTDSDGRAGQFLSQEAFTKGIYKMYFNTADYFKQQNTKGFYPYVEIVFEIEQPAEHYHIPLLLSPYGYSTYRGS